MVNSQEAVPEGGRHRFEGIECHEGDIPGFVETELERLYGHLYSSLSQMRAAGDRRDGIHTYVARASDQSIETIFLFVRERRRVRVVNEGMRLSCAEVERFAAYLFATDPATEAIVLHAVQIGPGRFSYPCQRHACLDDFVLNLPASETAYRSSLGKSARRNIKYYMNRLQRSHPSFSMRFYEKGEVPEQHVRRIVELHCQRMAGKQRQVGFDEDQMARLLRLSSGCGLVGVATIDGQVCGGTLGFCVGENYFMEMIAHDAVYNDDRVGTICCYLTIAEAIRRGCKEYHFLWGWFDYKTIFGAGRTMLERLALYRSPLCLVRNGGMALQIAHAGFMHRLEMRMMETAREPEYASPIARLALQTLQRVRGGRHAAQPKLTPVRQTADEAELDTLTDESR